MMNDKLTLVLQLRFPGAKFYISNSDLVWLDEDILRPSDEEIALWVSEIRAEPDWERLLRSSGAFVPKAQTTTNTNAFTLLVGALTSIRTVGYLEMSLAQVRTGMPVPYTASEIKALNKLFSDCSIPLTIT